ncbi:AEC family transporter [Paludibacterium paludis]|uniref:Transporter YwkB n=1 Tax=Paludibacterium paludis TaxID=1225769 RepID=A0A918UB52_9NEIS|nr:AEC family transporter [Paludibacterium paludis]GGY20884.1 putative transporter YwkB [Paludibacterium paludis]
MSVVANVLAPVIPVAIVIGLGYLAGRLRRMTRQDSQLISRLVLEWVFPAMLFCGMAGTPRAKLLDGAFIACALLCLMGLYLVVLLAGLRASDRRVATLRAFVCAFPDAAFMGIPILSMLFGPSSLYSVLVVNLVSSLVMIPLTAVLLERGAGDDRLAAFGRAVAISVRRPLVWAPLAGIALSLAGIAMPAAVSAGFTMLGSATPGVSLFGLGLIMSGVSLRLSREVLVNAVVKNLVHPVLAMGLLWLFGIHGALARELFLLAALPSATMTAMFASEAQVYEAEASGSILLGTVLSLVSFSLAIHFCAMLF